MIAAGLHGIDNELPLEPAFAGNAYESTTARSVPARCATALDLWEAATVRRAAFGDDVVGALREHARRSSWPPSTRR